MNKFAVSELLDARDGHFNDRSKIRRKGSAEVAAKSFVQGFERPHLIFGHAFWDA